jgi:hypothetical protein
VADKTCPTCHGMGYVWLTSGSKPRRGLNDDGAPCQVAIQCGTCPDDGTGNSVGTGRIMEHSHHG